MLAVRTTAIGRDADAFRLADAHKLALERESLCGVALGLGWPGKEPVNEVDNRLDLPGSTVG